MGEQDVDEIEAREAGVGAAAAKVFAGGATEILFLIGADGAGGAAEIGVGAGFDFDEDEDVAVAGDDIQLAAAGALMKIAGYHGETAAAEKTVGEIFAAAAMRLLHGGMRGSVAAADGIGQAIKTIRRRGEAVQADEKRLRQVVINLLGNAVKFTDRGRVCFKVTPHEGRVRFAFVDTGIGIPPNKVALLFKPFSQVSDAARNAEGTGLGLALSQRLVQLMGGTIQVESEFGRGSTFSFELELPPGTVSAFPDKPTENVSRINGYEGKRRKILVADDIPSNRAVLVEMLTPLGFQTVEAKDGRVALDLLTKEKPDLVLLDLAMPVLDGIQFIQYVRQIDACRNLPIIPISASVGEEEIKRCRILGCEDFLIKPVDYGRLLDRLKLRLGLEWTKVESAAEAEPMEEAPENTGPVAALPAEVAGLMADLARRGDLLNLRKEAEAFVAREPSYRLFLDRLRKLSEGFRVRQIRELIVEYSQPPSP